MGFDAKTTFRTNQKTPSGSSGVDDVKVVYASKETHLRKIQEKELFALMRQAAALEKDLEVANRSRENKQVISVSFFIFLLIRKFGSLLYSIIMSKSM